MLEGKPPAKKPAPAQVANTGAPQAGMVPSKHFNFSFQSVYVMENSEVTFLNKIKVHHTNKQKMK